MTTPGSPPRDLGHIQRWMQAVLMHPVGIAEGIASAKARQHIDVGPAEAEKVVTRSRALTALERLGIYGYAYYARLLECLREEFPVLMHALTQEVFDAFAVGYLQVYPSRSYTLLQLGANFPRYLAETRPEEGGGVGLPADWPDFLIDLATLELTFNEVFDGPGVEGERLLDADQLRDIPAERLAEARLVGVSCLRLLPLRYPVHRYFTAVRRHEDPVPYAAAETYLAVTRRRYVVRHYELSPPAYQLLRGLLAGESVGEAIGRAAEAAGPNLDRLAGNLRTWFHDWAAEGFFRAVECAE
jgi:Putative DNA-binding domain